MIPGTAEADFAGGPSGSLARTRLSRVADGCALATIAIGLLVVAGWLLDVDPLKRVLPTFVAMKFNSALGLVAAGAGLWWRDRPVTRIALGAVTALLGASALAEHLGGWNLGVDQLFLRDLPAPQEVGYPAGRMAPPTAVSFLLLGFALMGSRGDLRRPGAGAGELDRLSGVLGRAAELFALAATVIAFVTLIAYPTGATYLRQLPGFIGMGLHTAVALLLLGTGVLHAADGFFVETLLIRGTGRVLWIGFGLLTFLLVTVGTVFAVNTQRLAQDVEDQADVARPRKEATLELESRVLGYGLAVGLAAAGDTQAARAAADGAQEVDGQLARYAALATTDHQRILASRFAEQWRALRGHGELVLATGVRTRPQELARFAGLRSRLTDLLGKEVQPDAAEAFEARKATTRLRLQTVATLPLLLLVASVLLALMTSGAVARSVARQQRTLAEQREWLRVTLSSIGDGVIACDRERRVTFLNPVAEELTGWKAAEALGQPLADVLPLIDERTGAPAADIAGQVLREGRVVELANHTALLTRDGREIPIEDSAAPISHAGAGVTGVVLVFHDVTQRRRATDQLRESEARLNRSQAMAHLGSWELDHVSGRLTWSDEVYRIFGLEPQQFQATYEAFLEVVHPDDRAAVDAAYGGSLRDGRDGYELEHRLVRRGGGEVRTVHEKCLHVRDAEGRVLSSLGMVHDVTDRKLAEEALRRSEEKFAKAFHGSTSAMAITRLRDGAFIDVNERYLEVTRWTRAEVLGHSSPELAVWKRPEDRDRFVRALREHGRIEHEEFTFTRRGGEEWTGLVASQLSELDGEQVVVSSIVDITERKRAEEALAAAHLQLADTDQRRSEFLAVLSHELRNPLTPVRNSLRLLQRSLPENEQATRALEIIDRQTAQLTRLVDDLLEVTRVTRNKIRLRCAPLELGDLVRGCVEDHRASFDERGVILETALAPAPLAIHGDAARLAQVVGNLLQNAAKFTPRGGRVRVETAATPTGRARLSILDDGVGIDAAMLPRLFQPFTQADATLDRSKGGLGLGLALVKGLVELHGGEVRARSAGPGKGAEFVVELPIADRADVEVTPTAEPAAGRRRVVIIEDNVDAAATLREVLELGSHEVGVAHSGPEGLALAREFRPEVVLCDIGLPGMDGYAVARAFRAEAALSGVLLVALSGYALPEDLRRASEAGFDRHLPKPPDLERLERILAEAPSR